MIILEFPELFSRFRCDCHQYGGQCVSGNGGLRGGQSHMFYDYLSEFVAVAQGRSLSSAADLLNVSQPSLGRHMSSLETELGVKLIARSSDGIRLTEAGRVALAVAMDINELEDAVARHFSEKRRRTQCDHMVVSMPEECASLATEFTRAASGDPGGAHANGVSGSSVPFAPEVSSGAGLSALASDAASASPSVADSGAYLVHIAWSESCSASISALRQGDANIAVGFAADVEAAIASDRDVSQSGAGALASAQAGSPARDGASDPVSASASASACTADHALRCMPLACLPVLVALEPTHELAGRGGVRLADLRDLRFTRPSYESERGAESSILWREFEWACEQAGFVPTVRVTARDRRLGIEVRHVDDAILTMPGAGAEALRLAGKALVPVLDFSIDVLAVVRAEDEAACNLVTRAAELAGRDIKPVAVSQQTLYASPSPSESDAQIGRLDAADRARIYEKVIDEPTVTDDLVLPNGTVVDRVYVALRNRLNRIGNGLSNDPVETSYEAIMHLWSVEEAQAELEMPMMEWFTAYDYSASSGHELSWCEDMLERLASKCLVYRVVRGGIKYYCLLGWIYGIWEMSIGHYGGQFERWGITGSDENSGSQYPVLHACPVSADVVAGKTIAPYCDWQQYISRQSLACLAPCQCRLNEQELGTRVCSEDEHPMEVCLMFGEMAQFWLDNKLGCEIPVQEALEIGRKAVFDKGLVPQLYFSKNPEVLCFCHSDCCNVLAAVRAAGGSATSMKNTSAYRLAYDRDACVRCGACAKRCAMETLRYDEEGYCLPNKVCIGCGQCALVCPTGARKLVEKSPDEICPLPNDLPESYRWYATDRMARGHISDFTGKRLGTWSVDQGGQRKARQ